VDAGGVAIGEGDVGQIQAQRQSVGEREGGAELNAGAHERAAVALGAHD